MGRYNREHLACHESILFQTAQSLSQHLLRDATYLSEQIAVTLGFASQAGNYQNRPLVGQHVQNLLRWTTTIQYIRLICFTNHSVCIAQTGAYFPFGNFLLIKPEATAASN